MSLPPKTFISYAWEDDLHNTWVREFSTRLRRDGVDVVLDQWHAVPGDQLPHFMERSVRDSNYVLVVCTPKYKVRSDSRGGGVGYEGDIMTAEAYTGSDHRKFVPLLRKAEWKEAAPSWMLGKYYLDFRDDATSESAYKKLLRVLHGTLDAPPALGSPPAVPSAMSQRHGAGDNMDQRQAIAYDRVWRALQMARHAAQSLPTRLLGFNFGAIEETFAQISNAEEVLKVESIYLDDVTREMADELLGLLERTTKSETRHALSRGGELEALRRIAEAALRLETVIERKRSRH